MGQLTCCCAEERDPKTLEEREKASLSHARILRTKSNVRDKQKRKMELHKAKTVPPKKIDSVVTSLVEEEEKVYDAFAEHSDNKGRPSKLLSFGDPN